MNTSVISTWLTTLLTGFANAWSWLSTPLGSFSPYITGPLSGLTPLAIISFGGITTLIILGLIKVILDAIPVA